jgi:hypothetical protein
LIIIQDITERKQAEEKLQGYSERLEEMVEERTRELCEAQEQLVQRERLAVLGQLSLSTTLGSASRQKTWNGSLNHSLPPKPGALAWAWRWSRAW